MRNAIYVSAAIHMSVVGLLFSGDIDLVQRIIEEKSPMAVDYFVLSGSYRQNALEAYKCRQGITTTCLYATLGYLQGMPSYI
ncbi:MAG: hypothetical protein Q8N91_05530 [Candidatus Omnitrophota bacterium]|nr:hypothetical protein [Candidatus Omnitrophota bacterium]